MGDLVMYNFIILYLYNFVLIVARATDGHKGIADAYWVVNIAGRGPLRLPQFLQCGSDSEGRPRRTTSDVACQSL